MSTILTDNEICSACGAHFETEEHALGCPNIVVIARSPVWAWWLKAILYLTAWTIGWSILVIGGSV